MIKNEKMEKSYLSLNTYVQYVEDFKLWVLEARNSHRERDSKNVRDWNQSVDFS